MSDLKDHLIKLGNARPELRDHLKPVISHLHKTAGGVEDRPWDEALATLLDNLPPALLNHLNARDFEGRPRISVDKEMCEIRMRLRGVDCVVTFEEDGGEMLGSLEMGTSRPEYKSMPFPRSGHLAAHLADMIKTKLERM